MKGMMRCDETFKDQQGQEAITITPRWRAHRGKIVLLELSENSSRGVTDCPKEAVNLEAYSHHEKHGIGMRQK